MFQTLQIIRTCRYFFLLRGSGSGASSNCDLQLVLWQSNEDQHLQVWGCLDSPLEMRAVEFHHPVEPQSRTTAPPHPEEWARVDHLARVDTWRRPWCRPWTHWRDYTTYLTWEWLCVNLEELEEVDGEREDCDSHDLDKRRRKGGREDGWRFDEWMDDGC